MMRRPTRESALSHPVLSQALGAHPADPSYRMSSPFGPRTAPTPGASTFHKGQDFERLP